MPDEIPTVTVHTQEVVGCSGEQIIVQWVDNDDQVILIIKTTGQHRIIRLTENNAANLCWGLSRAVGSVHARGRID